MSITAPELATAKGYCGIVDEDTKFTVIYEGLKEEFEEDYSHIEDSKGVKELHKAFLMHLEYEFKLKPGIKSESDVDAKVEYSTEGLPSYIVSIYNKYKQPVDNTKTGGIMVF